MKNLCSNDKGGHGKRDKSSQVRRFVTHRDGARGRVGITTTVGGGLCAIVCTGDWVGGVVGVDWVGRSSGVGRGGSGGASGGCRV